MNQDIAHCDSDYSFPTPNGLLIEPRFCFKRDTCKRYKAYRNLKGDEEFPISFCSAVECIKENYKLYWEEKQ
jgi:hypothetical protein